MITKKEMVEDVLELYDGDITTGEIVRALRAIGKTVSSRTIQQVRKDWTELESMNLEYMCDGCKKADMKGFKCTVYATPPSPFIRMGCCPFNNPHFMRDNSDEGKKRAGQQKQRKGE